MLAGPGAEAGLEKEAEAEAKAELVLGGGIGLDIGGAPEVKEAVEEAK